MIKPPKPETLEALAKAMRPLNRAYDNAKGINAMWKHSTIKEAYRDSARGVLKILRVLGYDIVPTRKPRTVKR